MNLPAARTIDVDHWARPMVEAVIAIIDGYDEATFEVLAAVHGPAVCAVAAAHRPGQVPAISRAIVGADAWHAVFELAAALGIDVPA